MQVVLRKLIRGVDGVNWLCGWFLAALLLVMTVLISWQVFARYVVELLRVTPKATRMKRSHWRRQGWRVKAARKFKATVNSRHSLPLALSLLKQSFTAAAPSPEVDRGKPGLLSVLSAFVSRA